MKFNALLNSAEAQIALAATYLAATVGDILTPVGDFLRAKNGVDPLTGEDVSPAGRVVDGVMAASSIGPVGPRLARGIVRAERRAQGAAVAWNRIGDFVRGTWEVPGRQGASYVRWNRILNSEGETVRLYKDVYDQGGSFVRRDWYVR